MALVLQITVRQIMARRFSRDGGRFSCSVAARRQTAANFSTLFQMAALFGHPFPSDGRGHEGFHVPHVFGNTHVGIVRTRQGIIITRQWCNPLLGERTQARASDTFPNKKYQNCFSHKRTQRIFKSLKAAPRGRPQNTRAEFLP